MNSRPPAGTLRVLVVFWCAWQDVKELAWRYFGLSQAVGCWWLLKISLLALILVFSRVAISALTDGVGVVLWGREHPLHFSTAKASPSKYGEAARRPHPFGWGWAVCGLFVLLFPHSRMGIEDLGRASGDCPRVGIGRLALRRIIPCGGKILCRCSR